jgi:hypothetical protein
MKYLVFSVIGIVSLLIVARTYINANMSIFKTYEIAGTQWTTKIQLKKKAKENYELFAISYEKGNEIQTNTWPFAYEVFRLDTGDINNDNTADILVGVIKKTRFDSICRKRIFIFKLVDGYIRPLWLGSRVSQPLEDFRVCKGNPYNIIRTMELERDNSFLVAEYHWQGFGLAFIRYLARELSYKKATHIFKTN